MCDWNNTIKIKAEGNDILPSWMETFYPIHHSTIYFIQTVVSQMKTKAPLEIRNQASLLLFVTINCISQHHGSYLPGKPERKQQKQLPCAAIVCL